MEYEKALVLLIRSTVRSLQSLSFAEDGETSSTGETDITGDGLRRGDEFYWRRVGNSMSNPDWGRLFKGIGVSDPDFGSKCNSRGTKRVT